MPRKSIVNELQSEEVAVNSPVRRSTRIGNGNGTPAGVTTRRTSQVTESDAPAKATRGRRTSTQAIEENVESKSSSLKPEEELLKETTAPARRGRKPSVTSEPADKEEPEKLKPVRGRRTSRANSEDKEEEKPQKTAPVRSRRSSATIESEPEGKVTTKTPARAATRRRSSATENVVAEEVSTPSKRTTRGKKVPDTEEVIEEVKKPATRGRRKSMSQEEGTKIEEVAKPIAKRGRRTSTDDITTNAAPKTPGRSTRRTSINLEPAVEDNKDERNISCDENNIIAEEVISPITLKEISIKVTPLKKRKILEKMEAELDLSIINESSDDINSSKLEDSLKETVDNSESQIKFVGESSRIEELNGEIIGIQEELLSASRSTENVPSNKVNSTTRKRLSTELESELSPRKSPQSSEKSMSNTPKTERSIDVSPTSRIRSNVGNELSPRKSPRISEKLSRRNHPQGSPQLNVDGKLQMSHISSGSDSSFRFHLSTVSMAEVSNLENQQGDLLNTSKESTSSNKENIEVIDSAKTSDKSVIIPVQEPIVVARISNVFKPNQKECSFMEPMEVDECSVIIADNNSVMDRSVGLDESSVIFNRKAPTISTKIMANASSGNEKEYLQESSTGVEQSSEVPSNDNDKHDQKIAVEVTHQLSLVEDASKPSGAETECSDNLVIEETEETLDISVKQVAKKSELATSTSPVQDSKSPISMETSHITNNPLEKVKVVLSGKCSSPINAKRKSLRKSKSPLPNNDSTDSENETQDRLYVSRPVRRSKSKTPSPLKNEKNNVQMVPRKSYSKSKSPTSRRFSNIKKDNETQGVLAVERRKSISPAPLSNSDNDNDAEVEALSNMSRSKSKSPHKKKRLSRSPSFMPVIVDSKSRKSKSPASNDKSTLSGNRAIRSQSRSPLPEANLTPQTGKISGRQIASKMSPLQNLNENVIGQSIEKPRELGEVLISHEKVALDTSNNANILNQVDEPKPSESKSEDSHQTLISKSNVIEQTINEDKTEYHTAVATTNNDSEFNSIINTDNDVTQSETKHSESTHYDFDLPSDDDDELLDSNGTPCDIPRDTSLLDESTNVDLGQGNNMIEIQNEEPNSLKKTSASNALEATANDSKENGEHVKVVTKNDTPKSSKELELESEDDVFDENKDTNASKMTHSLQEQNNQNSNGTTVEDNSNKYLREVDSGTNKLSSQKETLTDYLKSNVENPIEIDDDEIHLKEIAKNVEGSIQDNNHIAEDTTKSSEIELETSTDIISVNDLDDPSKGNKSIIEKQDVNNKSSEDVAHSEDELKASKGESYLKGNNSIIEEKDTNKEPNENVTNISENELEASKSAISTNGSITEKTNLNLILLSNNSPNKNDVEANTKSNHTKTDSLTTTEFAETNLNSIPENHFPVIEPHDSESSTNPEGDKGIEDSKNEEKLEHSKKLDKDIIVNQKNKELSAHKENKQDATFIFLTTCKMIKKAEKLDVKSLKTIAQDEVPKQIKPRPSLDAFASAKLDEYLKSKAKNVQESSSEEEADEENGESEKEYNEFIDGMAEEGEEDTPSEDSNQIIEEGESIGSSDSEVAGSEDDYDQDDSFICDEEESELSGNEYDLGNEKKKKSKKSRIIDPNTLGDEEIIKIPKKKVGKKTPKKRSRIIKVSDSSSEEESKVEHLVKIEDGSKNVETKEPNSEGSIIFIDDDEENSKNIAFRDSKSNVLENVVVKDNSTIGESVIEDDSNIIVVEEVGNNESVSRNISLDALNVSLQKGHKRSFAEVDDSKVEKIINNESVLQNNSLNALNTSLQKRHRRSSLSIQENILVDGLKDPMLCKRINSLVESFCSTVKKGEIALNLSLEYEDSPEPSSAKQSDKSESVHILSDVKICPGSILNTEQEEHLTKDIECEKELSTSDDKVEDLRQVLNEKKLKRRLSKSLSEIYEEDIKAKRRKRNKKGKKYGSDEKLDEKNSKQNRKEKIKPDRSENPKMHSFSLMKQLITDVKNRPKRVVKPTKTASEAGSSWTETKVSNLKPSTSPVSKQEKIRVLPKLHPKDFKNQLLSDAKRVKRVETKTLLKKKGAFL